MKSFCCEVCRYLAKMKLNGDVEQQASVCASVWVWANGRREITYIIYYEFDSLRDTFLPYKKQNLNSGMHPAVPITKTMIHLQDFGLRLRTRRTIYKNDPRIYQDRIQLQAWQFLDRERVIAICWGGRNHYQWSHFELRIRQAKAIVDSISKISMDGSKHGPDYPV